ncbi:helix-turn-helix domain-containing protein [Fusibacter bizertensis]
MLGDRLKLVREELKLTQNTVAQFLNVKRQTYSAYERNKSIPDAITLSKLATYYRVTTDFLLSQELSKCEEELNIPEPSHHPEIEEQMEINKRISHVKLAIQSLIGLLQPQVTHNENDSDNIVFIISEGVSLAIKEFQEQYTSKK